MNLIEAAKFSQEQIKEIMIVGQPAKYKMVNGEMRYNRCGQDIWYYKTMSFDMVLADWQEWQEQREYFGFAEAMHGVLNGLNVGCEDFVTLESIYMDPHGQMVAIMLDGLGETGGFNLPREIIKSKKWYIITPTPEPEKPAFEGKDDYLPRLDPEDDHLPKPVSVMETFCNLCGSCFCECENNEFLPNPEPVFDLTYEEAREITHEQGGSVQYEDQGEEEFFKDDGIGEWVDEVGDSISCYSPHEIMSFACKKFRIVK